MEYSQPQDMNALLMALLQNTQAMPASSAYDQSQAAAEALQNQLQSLDKKDDRASGILGFFGRRSRDKKRAPLNDQYQSELARTLAAKKEYEAQLSQYNAQNDIRKTAMTEFLKQQFKDNRSTKGKEADELGYTGPQRADYYNRQGGGVTVNTGDKAPSGYQWAAGQGGEPMLKPIKGGPAAREIEEAENKKGLKANTQLGRVDAAMHEVGRALDTIDWTTAGFVGNRLANIDGTPSKELGGVLDMLKSNLGFERLQQMRDESQTGGALGQVSNIELNLLTSAVAKLDQGLSPEALKKNLGLVMDHYQRFRDAITGNIENPEEVLAGYDSALKQRQIEVSEKAEPTQEIYVNPQTGEKIRWDGKQWVIVK